jgi:hypothetical protein
MLVIHIDGKPVRPEKQYSSVAELKEILKEQLNCKDIRLTCNGTEIDDQNKWKLNGPSLFNTIIRATPVY